MKKPEQARQEIEIRVYEEEAIKEIHRSLRHAHSYLSIADRYVKQLDEDQKKTITKETIRLCHRDISKHLQIISYLLTDDPHIQSSLEEDSEAEQ